MLGARPRRKEHAGKVSNSRPALAIETVVETVQLLPLSSLRPHPRNPRLALREDIIEALRVNMEETGFRVEHAILVRPLADAYQIVSGHQRVEAARRAGLTEVPAWVRDMTDDEAYMELVTGNNQGELSPLEIGLHALHYVAREKGGNGKEGGLQAYANRLGKSRPYISQVRQAAEVFETLPETRKLTYGFLDKAQHLSAIHSAPQDLWPVLVDAMIQHKWTVQETEQAVQRVLSLATAIPSWYKFSGLSIAISDPTRARAAERALKVIGELETDLPETATLYHHQPSDVIEMRDGREYRRYDAVPSEYAARAEFRQQVLNHGSLPDADLARRWHRAILEKIDKHSDSAPRWQPVRTDAEEAEAKRREQELEALRQREAYLPEIVQGDALLRLPLFNPASFDLVVIDPPYGMDKDEWDPSLDHAAYGQWASPWLRESLRVLKDTGSLYVFGRFPQLAGLITTALDLGFRFGALITWETVQGATGGLWQGRVEHIVWLTKTAQPYTNPDAVRVERHEENVRAFRGVEYRYTSIGSVWRMPAVEDKHPERVDHPTQKPVELIERIIKATSPAEGRVLDFFAGSGTTGVAAMRLRRHAVLVERDSDYCEIIQDRVQATKIPGVEAR